MSFFERSVTLPAERSRVFDLHLDPASLKQFSPPWFQTALLSYRLPLHAGSVIAFDCRRFGLSQLWEVEIVQLTPDESLTFRALRSPFDRWQHEITLVSTPKGTLLTDRVFYRAPFYPLGLLLQPLIARELALGFKWRHQALAQLLAR